MLNRPPGAAGVSAACGLVSAGAAVAGLASVAAFAGGVAADTGVFLSASGASNVGGAFVSTVGSLSDDLAGAAAEGAALAGGSTGSVRVSNLRSGNGGMSRFWIALSVFGGALPRNIGTKMIVFLMIRPPP